MHVVNTVNDVRAIRHAHPMLTWGFVPTMGALHEGHLSLVRLARAANDRVAVSIFVNPTQFNNPDDLSAYPRSIDDDLTLLQAEGVDLVFAPEDGKMYPPGYQTAVEVGPLTEVLEGAHRPGHFQGVTTVVAKLFNIVQPTRAYFGQKDAQQVAVVRRMMRDLNMNLEIVVGPIVREPDGLALSSRNTLLNPAERRAATVLYRALTAATEAWQGGERDADTLREMMAGIIATEQLAQMEYVSAADPDSLQEIEGDIEQALLSMAVYVGQTRLIDNMLLGQDKA
jgi:pantoate--beta-alanine ligase